ncbi:dimethylhistidine N-methyltransferase [Lysobacter xinjiangensis]|uniref:Dimethylhistidine N-methyltransferase n=1 Tax=Cognatilysobacter xinjiangensis TaxID=546892 RepID=A0ABQ3CDH4_9GAMM|nr:L-histidine N(alpha)-methyltransferase [Lysobacter xinjiangensis]GGZ71764.1 dimethylhistidine N-methyltransferase [Lysobacter xinjiangensis]
MTLLHCLPRTAHATPALLDLRPTPDDLRSDVIAGLSASPKTLSSKYFYDERGSQLFEAITRQPEYDLTRTEIALLQQAMPSIRAAVGAEAHVVELGSGSARKTQLLLDGLDAPVAYTPVEISREMLLDATARLAEAFPDVQMLPVCADFTRPVPVPRAWMPAARTLLFFPGSTLGNFDEAQSVELLRAMCETMGEGGMALLGLDLVKDVADMEAAYNDAAGVTAEFTLNLLARLNRELGADFDLDGFVHRARWSAANSRIETSIVSRRAQLVRIDGRVFVFDAGEPIHVEISHKYTDDYFDAIAARAGLRVTRRWNAPADRFGLRLLERA